MNIRALTGTTTLTLYRMFVRARSKAFSLLSAGAFAEFGANTVIQLPLRISGEQRMAIGARVFIGSGAWLLTLADAEQPTEGVALRIGDDCGFAGGVVLAAVRSVMIGNHVYFARNCYVADHSHAYQDPSTNIEDQGLTDIRPVQIDDGVWLGENVVVLPGVHIGTGTVVGANSVVNVDLPSYCVALGSPARIIRRFGSSESADE